MTTVMLDKRDDGVALITLNRPERLNAFGEDLLPRLVEALVDCEDDSAIRCVALTGAGRGFSAGADINNMSRSGGRRPGPGREQPAEPPQSDADLGNAARDGHADGGAGQRSGRGRRSGPVPGDRLPVASDRARFVTAFRNIGVSGDYGCAWFLQRMVGITKARELLMLDRRIDAAEAEELGIVTQVVPHDELIPRGLEFCRAIAQGPTSVLAMMKWTLNFGANHNLSDSAVPGRRARGAVVHRRGQQGSREGVPGEASAGVRGALGIL